MRQIIYLFLFFLSTILTAQEEHKYTFDFRDSLWQQDLHPFDPMNHHSVQAHSNRQLTFRNDATNLIDSVYGYEFDPLADEWYLDSRDIYKYDSENRLISSLYQDWKRGFQKWETWIRQVRIYNQEGKLQEFHWQQFDEETNEFVTVQRDVSEYNQEGLESLKSVYLWFSYSQEWVLIHEYHYTYDADDNQKSLIHKKRVSGVLKNFEKTEYLRVGNNLIEEIEYSWDDLLEWVWTSHTLYNYTADLLTESLVQNWDSDSMQWINASRTIYEHNEDGLISMYVSQIWDNSNHEWVNNNRTILEYSESGVLYLFTYERWNIESGKWEGYAQYIDSYNDEGEITGFLGRTTTPSAYDSNGVARYLATYDERDSLRELIFQGWNEDFSLWETESRQVFTYDANGNLIYNGIHQWVDSIQQWIALVEEIWLYESDTLLSEHIYYSSWDPYRVKTSYQYDSIGQILIETDEHWDFGSMMWVHDYRYLYSYDSNNLLIENLYQDWVEEWTNIRRHLYTYNANGLKTEDINQQWIGEEWLNRYRTLYQYNEVNQKATVISQYWEDQWKNDTKSEYTYHYNGKIQIMIDVSWSSDENDWLNYAQRLYSYDDDDRLIKSEVYYWKKVDATWEIRYEYFWGYDANGNLVEDLYINHGWGYGYGDVYIFDEQSKILKQTSVEWDAVNQVWIDVDFITYGYNVEGNAIELIYFEWDSDQGLWQPMERAELGYDSLGFQATILFQLIDENSGTWLNYYSIDLLNNTNGKILEETWYILSPSEFAWIDEFRYDYFRSEHITGITEFPTEQLDCHYPNPFSTNGNTIVCDPTEGIDRYQVDLLDLTGRKIHSEIMLPGEPVTLDRTFPQGSYILLVRDKGKILHRNKLMIFD